MFSRKRRTRTPRTARPWLEDLEIRVVPAGTWTQLTNAFPDPNGTGTMMLLPNGKVMVLAEGFNDTSVPAEAFEELSSSNWYTLSADALGSYQNGTWTATASMSIGREAFSSNILPNGQVFVLGGEYTGAPGTLAESTSGEIYNPTTNSWTPITPLPVPPFPTAPGFGAGPSEVLPDGRILVGDAYDDLTWIYNPKNDTWIPGPTKLYDDQSQNETWIKLPDGSILSYDAWGYYDNKVLGYAQAVPFEAQKYIPSTTGGIGEWVDAGNVGYQLEDYSDGPEFYSSLGGLYENPFTGNTNSMGPGLLLNDGSVFLMGANGNTAVYTPGALPTDPGSWSMGPSVPPLPGNIPPDPMGANGAPAVVLPDGNVLFAVDDVVSPDAPYFAFPPYLGIPPTYLYDYNPATNSLTQVSTPPDLTSELDGVPACFTHMLVLPTGQVLLDDTYSDMWIYTPSDPVPASSQPVISYVSGGDESNTFTLTGTQLNGLNEGASFNCTSEAAENFPIVSLTDTHGDVWYVPSANWSSNWVQTGSTSETSNFTIPDIADGGPGPGAYVMTVSADGISSEPVMLIDMGTGVNDITIRLNPTNNHNIQVLEDDNTLLAEFPQSDFSDIYAITNSPTDTLTIDNSSGDPIPAGGSMLYEGGTGIDTIVGSNNTNDWLLTSFNTGTLNGDVTFTDVPNLTGGSGADDFVFQPGSDITGKVNGGSGYATIDLSLTSQTYPPVAGLTAGTLHGYQDASGAPPVITGTFDNIDFIRTAGQHLLATTQPSNGIVGAPFGFVVEVEDSNGLVNPTYNGPLTVSLAGNPSGAQLSGGPLTINAVNGVGTFSGLLLDNAGNGYTLTVTSPIVDAEGNTVIDPVTTNEFNIVPNTPTKLVVTTQPPTSITAGVGFGLTVKAEDNNGFVATTYNGSVNAEIADNPGGSTFFYVTVPIVDGVANFNNLLTLNKTGTGYTLLLFSNTPLILTSTTTTTINVVAAKATQLVINPEPPASISAGSLFGFTVYAEDPFGNVDLTFNQQVTVSLSSSSYSGTLSGTLTATAVNGVATFSNLMLNRVGSTTLDVQAVLSGGMASAISSAISVVPGQATQLVFATNPPSTVQAGVTFPLVVQVEDALGNLATPFTGNVTVSVADSSTGAELLQGNTLTVPAVGGVATFLGLSMDLAGTGYAVITSGQGLAPNTSTYFNVTALPASQLVVTTEPSSKVAAGTIMNVVVSAEDIFGNVDPSFNGNVSIGILNNPGSATLNGTLTQAAVGGVATFPNLQITVAANGYTLLATNGTLFSAASNSFNVTPGTATQLVVTNQPNDATVFLPISFTVSAEDPYGNVDPTFNGQVRANIGTNPGSATLAGTVALSASNGVVTFSGLTLSKPGVGYTLTASSDGFLTTTEPFTVFSGTATQLAVTTEPPSSVTAGNDFTVAVSAEDSNGNVDPTFDGEVTLVLATNPGGSSLDNQPYQTATAVNGVATFSDLTLNVAAGGYVLQASNGSATTQTTPFNVTPGAATQLIVTGEPPANIAAGTGFGLTVTGEDAYGNAATSFNGRVSLALGSNPGGSTLGGNTTVTALDGVATFSGLTLNKADPDYVLQAGSAGLTSGSTAAVAVSAGTATQLVVTTAAPAGVTAGVPFGFSVSAEDADGNVNSTFNGNVTVSFVNNAGGSTLGGTATVGAIGGVATFSGLTLNKVGANYTLQATSGSLATADTGSIAVTPNVATQLLVTTQPPASVTAGLGFGFTVTAEDSYGNVATSFDGVVTPAIGTNPSGVGVLGGMSSATASNGVAVFSGVTLNIADPGYVLQAGSPGLTSGSTNAFKVVAAPATQLVVTTQPGNVTAGAGIDVVVSAEDPYGNVNASFTGGVTVSLESNPGSGSLGGALSVNANSGVATFSTLTLTKPGTGYTLQFSGGGLSSALTNGFNVMPAAANHLVVTTEPPSSVTPGAGFGFTVSAYDPYGNLDTNFAGDVTASLSTNPGNTTLGGSTIVQAHGGIATFSGLTIGVGDPGYVVQLTSGNLNPGTTSAVDVTPGHATTLVVTTQPPASVSAGAGFGFSVSAEDGSGNVDATFSGDVTVSLFSNPGSGTLGGVLTVQAVNGVANFSNLALDVAGSGYVLQVSGGLTPGVTNSFSVTPSTATQLVLTSPAPATVAAGTGFGFAVSAEDLYGNAVSSFSGSVTVAFASNPANGSLGGGASVTTVNAIDGVATFSGLTLNTVGTGYVLEAISGNLAPAVTGAIGVTPGAATQLVVTTAPPANILVGGGFGLVVTAEDADGNVVPTFNGSVTVALSGSSGATLGGTLTVNAKNGVATFSGLTLNQTGNGYTLNATSGGLTPATISGFNEVSGTPTTTASISGPLGGGGWYQSAVTVTLNTSDPIYAVTSTFYQVDNGPYLQYTGPFLVSGNGSHNVQFYSMDSAGQQENVETTSFKIDSTPPVTKAKVTGTTVAGGWYKTPPTLTLTATDPSPGSGVAATYYFIDNNLPVLYTGPVQVTNGNHLIGYFSVDVAGNQAATQYINVKVDTAPPTTTINVVSGKLGNNGFYTSAVKVALSATDNGGSGVAATYYKVGSGAWTLYRANAVITISAQGNTTLSYYSIDAVGNKGAVEATTFSIESVPPPLTVKLTAVTAKNVTNVPVSGTSSAGATITILVTDSKGNTLPSFSTTANSKGVWSLDFSAVSLAVGALTFEITAANEAGLQKVVTQKTSNSA